MLTHCHQSLRRNGQAAIVALLRDGADLFRLSPAGEGPLEICALSDAAQGALPEDPAATAVVALVSVYVCIPRPVSTEPKEY